jgi:hypothetical protein
VPSPQPQHPHAPCFPPASVLYRCCIAPSQVHPQMARELFAAGFVSCWSELDPASQEQLVRSLEAALASPTIPPGETQPQGVVCGCTGGL